MRFLYPLVFGVSRAMGPFRGLDNLGDSDTMALPESESQEVRQFELGPEFFEGILIDSVTLINPHLANMVDSDDEPADDAALIDLEDSSFPWSLASSNPDLWEEVKPRFLKSPQAHEFCKLANYLLRLAATSGIANHHIVGWLSFVTEIADFIGIEYFHPGHLSQVIRMLERYRGGHRELSPIDLEIRSQSPFVQAGPGFFVAIARSIDAFATDNVSIEDLLSFTEVLDHIRPITFRTSAGEAIIYRQIQSKICPNLLQILENARIDYKEFKDFRPSGIKLVEICKAAPPSIDVNLVECSIVLGGDISLPLQYADAHRLLSDLHNPRIEWKGGLYLPRLANLSNFVNRVMVSFAESHKVPIRPAEEFETRQEFENYHLAFGRLLGLSIRHSLPMIPVEYLKPETAAAIRKSNPERHAIDFEAVFHIRMGIEETLGPAWKIIFTQAEWKSFFSP